jgi:hypothetical protein
LDTKSLENCVAGESAGEMKKEIDRINKEIKVCFVSK